MDNTMIKIDSLDKRILYALDYNCRMKIDEMSKMINVPMSTIDFRKKRLEKNGFIDNYYAVINSFKLGFKCFRLYLSLQYISDKILNDIIKNFVNNEYSGFVVTISGKYDLAITFWVNEEFTFFNYIENIIGKYAEHVNNYVLSNYQKWITYKPEYLIEKKFRDKIRKFELTAPDKKIIKIDKIDNEILKLLSTNGNMKFNEMSDKLNLTTKIVRHRYKKFLNFGIIQGFRANINLKKFGFNNYKINIYLKNFKNKKKIIEYIKLNPYLWAIDYTFGFADIEFEFHLDDYSQIENIMEDIKIKFPQTIRTYDFFIPRNWYKFSWFL